MPTKPTENLDPMMSLGDVPWNDMDAARRYYRAHGQRLQRDEYEALAHLHDDVDGFVRATRRWNVVD